MFKRLWTPLETVFIASVTKFPAVFAASSSVFTAFATSLVPTFSVVGTNVLSTTVLSTTVFTSLITVFSTVFSTTVFVVLTTVFCTFSFFPASLPIK